MRALTDHELDTVAAGWMRTASFSYVRQSNQGDFNNVGGGLIAVGVLNGAQIGILSNQNQGHTNYNG